MTFPPLRLSRRAVLLALAAGPFLTASGADKAAGTLKLMSFNLRYINREDTGEKAWTARREQVADLIKRQAPDILGVQEALRPMLDDIRPKLEGYEEVGVGREDGKTQGEYAAILWKKSAFKLLDSGTFWLSDTPDVPNSRTWGNTVTRICTWAKFSAGERVFHVFNAHLDHQSQPSREKAIALILERMAAREPKGPVFFMGDLNAGEDNLVVKQIAAHELGLSDTWRRLHPETPAAESGTVHFFSGRTDMAKIDYIFAPSALKVTSAEILRDARGGNYPSDHYPVTATIAW